MLVVLFLLPALLSAWPWSIKWREVTAEERAMTTPRIDPEAGAEYLISEMEVDESLGYETVYMQYLRLKVFNERGVRDLQQIDIEAGTNQRIQRIAARVIRPDGTIEELPKDAFHDREVVRRGRARVRAKSFSIPNLEPGTIIEYQFERTLSGDRLGGGPYVLNERFPVHVATFMMVRYHPLPVSYVYFETGDAKLENQRGHQVLTLHDLPAISTEPFLPPFYETVSWLMATYMQKSFDGPEEYWEELARELYFHGKRSIKPRQRLVRETAERLTAGVTDPAEKIDRIYHFCVEEIENLTSGWNTRSSEEKEKLKSNDSPSDTLKHGYGEQFDIDILFASLVEASGFEVRVALANDHALLRFNKNSMSSLGVSDYLIAVKWGEGWRLFDPGTPYLDTGSLHWSNEFVVTLLGDKKEARFLNSPISVSKSNLVTREGDLSLTDDGTLEGSVSITYRGQWAKAMKDRMDGTTQTVREERVEHDLQVVLPLAEVSAIEFTNLRDPTKEVILSFHLRVPNYGESLSKRVFFQINPFEFTGAQAGGGDSINDHVTFSLLGMDDLLVRTPRFILEKRDFSIYVPFNYAVDDTIKISLPEGFELEEASAPAGNTELDFVDHTLSISFSRSEHQLIVKRHFRVARCEIAAKDYASMKQLFELFHARDQHMLTVRRETD